MQSQGLPLVKMEMVHEPHKYENRTGLSTEDQLAEQKVKLRLMTAELSLAEERERHRIAMDIHDSIGQTLAIIKMKLTELKKLDTSPELNGRIREILEYTEQTIRETRSLSYELSPAVLYTLGLDAAVENLVDKIREKHGVQIEMINDDQEKPLSEPSRIHLYRSVRELLFNIIKHARAEHIRIHLIREKHEIWITIEDDGCGFDNSRLTCQPGPGGGFGLFSIRERLNHLGGNFVIHSEPGQGTRVFLSAPLAVSLV